MVSEAVRNAGAVLNHINRSVPGTYISSAGGGLGYSGAMAVGAKLARPQSRVVQIAGDGSFHRGMAADRPGRPGEGRRRSPRMKLVQAAVDPHQVAVEPKDRVSGCPRVLPGGGLWEQKSAFKFPLRPENLWVPGWARRLGQSVLPYENRDTQVPEQLRFCHSKFESATSTAADGAELSTATGGRRSRRTPGRRGGQLVSAGENDRKPPTNNPEEPNFLSSGASIFGLTRTAVEVVMCEITSSRVTEQRICSRGRFDHWLLFAPTNAGSSWPISGFPARRLPGSPNRTTEIRQPGRRRVWPPSTLCGHPPIVPKADRRPCRVNKHGPLQAGATPLPRCGGPATGQPDVEKFDTWRRAAPRCAALRRAAPHRTAYFVDSIEESSLGTGAGP